MEAKGRTLRGRVHLPQPGNTIFMFLLHYSNHQVKVPSQPPPLPVLICCLRTPQNTAARKHPTNSVKCVEWSNAAPLQGCD